MIQMAAAPLAGLWTEDNEKQSGAEHVAWAEHTECTEHIVLNH